MAPSPLVTSLDNLDPSVDTVAATGAAIETADLALLRKLRVLWISGFREATAVALARRPDIQSLIIHDYRMNDFAALDILDSLQTLVIAGSSKLKSLRGIEKHEQLETLILFDNCNYTDLNPLKGLSNLSTLCLEGGFSKPLRVATLAPLNHLKALVRLRLASIRADDKSLQSLASLTSLRDVFVAKMFPPSELRALAAALPLAKGEFLDDYRSGA